MTQVHEYDVIVIGGGPAGSATAAVLAEHGRKVAILEKEHFPRYHIGESLIPYTYFPLERLGLIEKMRTSHFPRKYSVQFVRQTGELSQPFYFTQHTDHPCAQTWQVLRSEFDQILLENAVEKGAVLHQPMLAREAIEQDGAVVGVRAEGPDGRKVEFRAPVTMDATGRDAFYLNRAGWKVRDPQLDKMAIWTYYRGATRDPGIDEGATTVAFLPDKGWFWYIPLPNDVVSVGVVAEREYLYRGPRDLEAIFQREVKQNRWIEEHVAPGQVIEPYRATAEYSYRSRFCAGDGLVLVGDAFAFLDPVFSSGVCLALYSGVRAGDAVHQALAAGDVSAGRFAEYGEDLCKCIEAMRRLVYAFYDHAFSMRQLFDKYPHLQADVTECLIGNLNRDFEPLFSAVSEFAPMPEPLPYGRARMATVAV